MNSGTTLFKALEFGSRLLKTRIVMSPMSRFRANDQHVQLPYAKDYYAQRATDGSLIVSENTAVSPRAAGSSNAPGIWTAEQIAAWKEIVEAVHAKGGVFFMQLCALGRTADSEVLKTESGADVVSASAIPMSVDAIAPRPLAEEEIGLVVQDFVQAARNAIDGAGFDGVELHGAYGYLIDQFTQDVSNKRTDMYGGSVENRSRVALEVAQAVVNAVGADKVGYRISPWSTFQGMGMSDPVPQFTHLITGLAKLQLNYLHLIVDRGSGGEESGGVDTNSKATIDFALDAWGHTRTVLLASGFGVDSAIATVDNIYKGRNIAIVFGRWYTSNPDLVYRIKHGIALSPYNHSTFYSGGETGYTDQKYCEEYLKENSL